MPSLTRLDLFHVEIPLRKPIRHASHERTGSESVVARVTLDDGSTGYGEGVPRPYVTGETVATAFEALGSVDAARLVGPVESFPDAVGRLSRFTLPTIEADPRGMFGNAARAAFEVAAFDAFGRSFGCSLGEAVRLACENPGLLRPIAGPVRYSGAITAETPYREWKGAVKMALYRFDQVKLKVGVAGQDDPRRLGRVRSILGAKVDIRLDANEAWTPAEVVDRIKALLPGRPSLIEQPVPHREVDSLAEIRPRLGLSIMLDESLCGFPDGRAAVDRGTADLFNVRISKCGGIGPTLRLIDLAHRNGLGVQLGCHPGETGLLSAAGRHLAANLDGLRYVEGSYDRHVLKRNLTRQDPTFGFGGWARPIVGPGLGVEVDPDALAAMTIDRREIIYD